MVDNRQSKRPKDTTFGIKKVFDGPVYILTVTNNDTRLSAYLNNKTTITIRNVFYMTKGNHTDMLMYDMQAMINPEPFDKTI